MSRASARLRTPLNAADLLAAWQVRRRSDWPPTYCQAMASPLYAALVRAQAIAAALAAQRASLAQQHAGLDFKRRAAGERDDD